ncbi:hypothetical protein I4U23_013654 [Adineta vaga]|nr:hypothetical protein I4U23_013654 [Adineta vaga]
MASVLFNQSEKTSTNHKHFSINDSYADALLRTFASLKQPSSSMLYTKTPEHNRVVSPLPNLNDDSLIEIASSSSSSSSSSSIEEEFQFETRLPLSSNKSECLKKFQRLLSRLDTFYNTADMSTETLLPLSTHINDRYFFHKRLSRKHKSNQTSPSLAKRYRFSSTSSTDQIYNFSTNQNEQRSYSSDSNRYYFSSDNSMKYSPLTLTYLQTGSHLEPRSMQLLEETTTITSDTPYLFSNTTESVRYPSTASTFIYTDDKWSYRRPPSQKMVNTVRTFTRQPTTPPPRTDTVTSTNGELSILRRSPTGKLAAVHFEPTSTVQPFEKSVDRLISSVNKKYRSQQTHSSSTATTSLSYISQYYAKEEEVLNECLLENENDRQKLYSSLNTNRIHTQIMKNVNKSLLDRNYQSEKTRLKHFEQNARLYLRSYENQALQRELNYNLIRCFSTTYLDDLRHEEIRHNQTRQYTYSYTYEDIQDIYVPSVLEAYKIRTGIDRERQSRIQSSIPVGQLSPVSSSGYSPIMIESYNDNMDTQIGSFASEQKSHLSISQTPANTRLDVDVFYEIMHESFRGVDASIAGHVSKASQYTKQKSHPSQTKTREYDSDIDIKSNSSFWSDEDEGPQTEDKHQRKTIPHQRKLSRYLSTVNRSLLDRPSDLIADFYLSQLNRNMQDSVRHIETIARDKAYKHEIIDGIRTKLNRSLSAEHLYQVRKEHLRYKQPFITPTSFTTEDVADIYKPSILENYKRKIAIELERRRRQRPTQPISGISSVSTYTSDVHFSNNVIKSSHPPIIDFHHGNHLQPDFPIVSAPTIVQTKEIVMGRARRTLTDDGGDMIIQHVSTTLPPPIHSDCRKPSSSRRKITIIATINDHCKETAVTDVDLQNSINKQYLNDEMMDGVISASKQFDGIITCHSPPPIPPRPKAKIYTNIHSTNSIEICQANLVESNDPHLSMVSINQTIPIQQAQPLRIPVHDYQHATIFTSPQHLLSLVDQSDDEQLTQFIAQQPEYEHGTLFISQEEQIAKIQQDIPIFEVVRNSHPFIPSISNVNEIQNDNKYSLFTSQINEQPTVLQASNICQLDLTDENMIDEHTVELPEEFANMDEQLPEIEKTTVQMEYSYVTSFIQLPINHTIPPASLLGELHSTAEIQHATQIIDHNYYLKPCEIVQENVRMAIIVDDNEWKDEQLEIIPDESLLPTLQNAHYTYSESIEYEQVKINHPEQNFEIFDNEEQIKSLATENLNFIQHQQQSTLQINTQPVLENPLHSKTVLTLNYAHHNRKHLQKEPSSISSSFRDMEVYLNHFEETLSHEQHLPLVDQISLSYATSYAAAAAAKNEHPTRSLPVEWFQPTLHLHDEQLAEQVTVIKDVDTFQQEGTLQRHQMELKCAHINIFTDTDACYSDNKSNNSTLIDVQNHTHMPDSVSHQFSSDDSVDKDNDTITCVINNTLINPQALEDNLPTSSIATTTLLSQSSPPLTPSSAPAVPIAYFLDALAVDQNQTSNPMKDFLLTIGFGQNDTNELTNTVSAVDQLSRPTWINRPLSEKMVMLPTIIHQEDQLTQEPRQEANLHYANENQLDDDDETALIVPSYRLQFGHDLSENVQKPLCPVFEPSYLHLPIINEIYVYRMSFHHDFPLFHPPDILPHILVSKTHEDAILPSTECQVKQPKILAFAQINDLLEYEEDIQILTRKLDSPSYIEHYHVQPLHPFPEVCYAEINQPEIINKNEKNFSLNLLNIEDDDELNQGDQIKLMEENLGKITIENQYGKSSYLPTIPIAVEKKNINICQLFSP